jgi:hypothetical protein
MMIINELESNDYQCPMKFSSGPGRTCSGSMCMAWRWTQEQNPNYHPANNLAELLELPWRESKTHGYCGLAGKP